MIQAKKSEEQGGHKDTLVLVSADEQISEIFTVSPHYSNLNSNTIPLQKIPLFHPIHFKTYFFL